MRATVRTPFRLAACIAVLVVGCLTPVQLTPARAANGGSTLLSETFSGTSVTDAAISPLGAACLTAATDSPPADQSKLGPCARRNGTPSGTPGYLQITDASGNQAGAVLYNRALPANGGIDVTFDQYQYGGSGADGIAFFLVDGSANLTATGAAGGSLGYAQNSTTPGVSGGYVGVGLDAWGNFANDGESKGEGCNPRSPHSGEKRNNVTVRGPGDGRTGYCWLASNLQLPGSLRSATASATDPAPGRRTVHISVAPDAKPKVTVEIDFHDGKGLQNVLTTELPSPLPSTFKFGLAGSTGGATDVHLIRNVSVASVVALPPINLVKQVNKNRPQPASYTEGDTVPYDFVVTNTTNAPLTGVAVNDPKVSSVSCPSTTLAPAGQPGSTMVCTGSRVLTAADAQQSTFTNTATAGAVDGEGNPVSATSTVTVPMTPKANLSIVKTTTKQLVTEVGEAVPFTFTVTNLGNLPIKDIAVTDPIVDQVTCPATELGPGDHTVCTATYSTTQDDLDAGQVANIAEVTGNDPNGAKVTAHSGSVIIPALFDPAVSVVKTSDATTFSSRGEQIPYRFTVTNTGNVTLDDIVVSDPRVGHVNCAGTRLASGSRTSCSATYTVTQEDLDAGQIVNQAAVTGLAPGGRETVGVSNQHVLTGTPRPELAIVKSTSATFYDGVGDPFDYSFVITNTGNQTITDVVVSDPRLGGTVCSVPSLGPGDEHACDAPYRVTAGDLDAGRVANQATASGTSPSQTPVAATSNEVVVPGIYRPEFTMVKSTGTTTFDAPGVKIPFRFTVINTGNVTLDKVTVTDTKITDISCPETKLPLGEQMTCEGVYTATQADVDAGRLVNQATVDGDPPPGGPDLPPVSSNEVIVSGVQRPGFSMVKSADTSEVNTAGQKVTYRFAITNTGNTTIENVAITDPKVPEVNCPAKVVAPGASLTCTGVYTVTEDDMKAGRVVNIATATGNVPGHPPLPPVRSNQVETRAVPAPLALNPAGDPAPATGVLGEVVTQPGVTVPPTAAPTTESQLPRTGRNVVRLLLAALGLAVFGGLLRTLRP
jgi:uncharacterized repeat protein (TIGR01451 family)